MSKLEVGDRIRILEDRLEGATVYVGDVLEVRKVLGEGSFTTEAPRLTHISGSWWFGFKNEGTGWEKVEEAGE